MKILVFSNTFYPVIGGMESNSETLLQALEELGHQASLLTQSQLDGQQEIKRNYPIIRDKSLLQFQKQLKGSDLLIVNGDISVPACFMAYLNHVPYVIIYQMAGNIVPRKGGLTHNYLHKLRLFLGSKAIFHLGVSKACIESKNVFKKQEGVLYNPISTELLSYSRRPDIINSQKVYDVLFAGRVIDGKGINVLAEALQILDKQNVKLKALISGEGKEKEELQKKTSSFENVRVDYQSFVKGEKLASTFAKSKIMVLASTTHQEGSPLSIVEAFAFGLPVIVSNQNVMLELIGNDAGLSHKSGNANELSNKIQQGLSIPEYYKLSDSARMKAEKFTYKIYLNRLKEILNSL